MLKRYLLAISAAPALYALLIPMVLLLVGLLLHMVVAVPILGFKQALPIFKSMLYCFLVIGIPCAILFAVINKIAVKKFTVGNYGSDAWVIETAPNGTKSLARVFVKNDMATYTVVKLMSFFQNQEVIRGGVSSVIDGVKIVIPISIELESTGDWVAEEVAAQQAETGLSSVANVLAQKVLQSLPDEITRVEILRRTLDTESFSIRALAEMRKYTKFPKSPYSNVKIECIKFGQPEAQMVV